MFVQKASEELSSHLCPGWGIHGNLEVAMTGGWHAQIPRGQFIARLPGRLALGHAILIELLFTVVTPLSWVKPSILLTSSIRKANAQTQVDQRRWGAEISRKGNARTWKDQCIDSSTLLYIILYIFCSALHAHNCVLHRSTMCEQAFISIHIHYRTVFPLRLKLEITDVDMLCSFTLTALPRPCVLLLSSQCATADLSRKSAVSNMAGHLSIPPQAVGVPFNLTCNFPGEVYKSHRILMW